MTSAAWLTRASGPWAEPQSVAYLVNGDRRSVNDKAYCYEPGSHRLARVADVLYRSNPEGAIWKREAPDGRATTYCWNPVGQLGALIDSGGQATGFVYNHRRQRVAEIWPINGLRAEYRTDATSRLTSEELPGSLQQEFPGRFASTSGSATSRWPSSVRNGRPMAPRRPPGRARRRNRRIRPRDSQPCARAVRAATRPAESAAAEHARDEEPVHLRDARCCRPRIACDARAHRRAEPGHLRCGSSHRLGVTGAAWRSAAHVGGRSMAWAIPDGSRSTATAIEELRRGSRLQDPSDPE